MYVTITLTDTQCVTHLHAQGANGDPSEYPIPGEIGSKILGWSANLTLRLLPLVRDSGTILRGRLIDLDDAALTTGYPDIVDLIAQHRSPSYSKTVWGLLQVSEKESLQVTAGWTLWRCSTPFAKLLVPLERKKLCRTLTNYAPDQRANDTTLDID